MEKDFGFSDQLCPLTTFLLGKKNLSRPKSMYRPLLIKWSILSTYIKPHFIFKTLLNEKDMVANYMAIKWNLKNMIKKKRENLEWQRIGCIWRVSVIWSVWTFTKPNKCMHVVKNKTSFTRLMIQFLHSLDWKQFLFWWGCGSCNTFSWILFKSQLSHWCYLYHPAFTCVQFTCWIMGMSLLVVCL